VWLVFRWAGMVGVWSEQDKRANPGNLPKSNVLSEIGERWTEGCLLFVLRELVISFLGL